MVLSVGGTAAAATAAAAAAVGGAVHSTCYHSTLCNRFLLRISQKYTCPHTTVLEIGLYELSYFGIFTPKSAYIKL